jgi:hypothetical protein
MDRYTKTVLTVIAVALSVIALRATPIVGTAGAFGEACGSSLDPCYVATRDSLSVDVIGAVKTYPAY